MQTRTEAILWPDEMEGSRVSPEVIRRCLEAEPFIPFSMTTTDHRDIEIENPQMMKMTSDGKAVEVDLPACRMFLAIDHIISLTVVTDSKKWFGFAPPNRKR